MRRILIVKTRFSSHKLPNKTFSSINLFDGSYSFIKPLATSETLNTIKVDDFADYFVEKYSGKTRKDEHFIFDNFIKDSLYISQKYKHPIGIKEIDLKTIRSFPFHDQISFFIGFLKLNQEALTANQQFIKDFRKYFMMNKHEKLAEFFTDPYLDLKFRTQDFGPFNYKYKRSYIGLLKLINDLYPISIYNLVYLFCHYNLISMLKETTEDKEITYLVDNSVSNFVQRLNLNNKFEAITMIRFVNLIRDKFNNIIQRNKGYAQLLNVLDNFYLNLNNIEAVKSLVENEDYPKVLLIGHIIKASYILIENNFQNGQKIIDACMSLLSNIDWDRTPTIDIVTLIETIILLEASQVDRDILSKILLSEQIVAFAVLNKSIQRLLVTACQKFNVKPYPIDNVSRIDGVIHTMYERTENPIDSLQKSFIYGKEYMDAISKNSYYGRAYNIYNKMLYEDMFKNLNADDIKKGEIPQSDVVKALKISTDFIRYLSPCEAIYFIKDWIELLNSIPMADMPMQTNKEVINLLDEVIKHTRTNSCYLSQFIGMVGVSVVFNKNGYPDHHRHLASFDNFCTRYVKLLSTKISSYVELKNILNLLLIILRVNPIADMEQAIRIMVEKSQIVITHMKTKNKASLNFMQSHVQLINIAIEKYPKVFDVTSNAELMDNIEFCIKTVVENKNVDISNKIEIFGNIHNLYHVMSNKIAIKYLYETQVLQPLLRMFEQTAIDTKLDNLTQHNFTFGKHSIYSVCTNLIKLIDILDIKLTDSQLTSIFSIYERAVQFVQTNQILSHLETVSKYPQGKNCVPLLLEGLFGRHEILTSLDDTKSVLFNVFYNTDKKRIDIENFLDYMIINDIRMTHTKTSLGLTFYMYEELSDKRLSISILSKFYKQLDKLNDVNLLFFNIAVKDYLSTVNINDVNFFDIMYLPFEYLPDKYQQVVVSGNNFGVTQWEPRSLNILIEYLSRNNTYIPTFVNVLKDNLNILIDFDVNLSLLAKLNVPFVDLDKYADLMMSLIKANKLSKTDVTNVIFTYLVTKEYAKVKDTNSQFEKFDAFYNNLVNEVIIKEDIFGLIQYNNELQAFSYPSFEKVMGMVITDCGTPDTIIGKFDTPTKYDISVDEHIKLKGELMLEENCKFNTEIYKRFYFWSAFNDRFISVHKFPMEYNNIHYKKVEKYHVEASRGFYKILKVLRNYKSGESSSLKLKTFYSDESYYVFVPEEFKYNVATNNGVQREISNVSKYLIMLRNQTTPDESTNVSVISLNEIESDPNLIKSLKLVGNKTPSYDDGETEDTEAPDVIKSALEGGKPGIDV